MAASLDWVRRVDLDGSSQSGIDAIHPRFDEFIDGNRDIDVGHWMLSSLTCARWVPSTRRSAALVLATSKGHLLVAEAETRPLPAHEARHDSSSAARTRPYRNHH